LNRRAWLGLLLLVGLVLLGRGVRHLLLCDPAGGWREPGWLEARLPPLTAPAPAPAPPPGRRRPAAPLDPNTCPADSLVLLPGIGPVLAERIVAARVAGLHFACARDLQGVRGIGPRTAARIAPYLTFIESDSATGPDTRNATAAPADHAASGRNPSRAPVADR